MSIEDRQRWEQRHQRPMIQDARPSVLALAPGADATALDLACGQGRHSVTLARKGYRVVAMDIAMPALRIVSDSAIGIDCNRIFAVQGDTDAWPFAPSAFDLIVQIDFLDRSLFPHLRGALREGGRLLIDTFLDQGRRNADGPSRAEFLLTRGELPQAFEDFEILHYVEETGTTARAVLFARKRWAQATVRENAVGMRAR